MSDLRDGTGLDAATLAEALRAWSNDMHHPSMRPCETCRKATEAMGEPMGCYAFQARGGRRT